MEGPTEQLAQAYTAPCMRGQRFPDRLHIIRKHTYELYSVTERPLGLFS